MTVLKEIKPTFLFPSLYFSCLLLQFPKSLCIMVKEVLLSSLNGSEE